jgi:pectinesterase
VAANATLVVDGAADGDDEYATIQAALNDSTDGDRIEVRPGTYTEELVIDSNVTLVAPSGATLSGTGLGRVSYAITIEGDAAPTVSSFRIVGYAAGAQAPDTTSDWRLTGLEMVNVSLGVTADGAAGDWVVADTTVENVSANAIDVPRTSGDWVVRNVTIEAANYGVSGEGTGHWEVRNSTIRAGQVGILARGSNAGESTGNWTVANTTIRGGLGGIDAHDDETDWVVRDSRVLDSSRDGLFAGSTSGDWTVRNTVIRGAGGDAVDADATEGDWTILNSTLADSGGDAVYASGGVPDMTGGDRSIHNTSFLNNSGHGVYAAAPENIYSPPRVDATRNWWGDSNGPDEDDCVGNVTCGDYLTEPPSGDARSGEDGGQLFEAPIPGAGDAPPTDPDGDGMYEDVDGSGNATFDDAIALAFADTSGLAAAQRTALDFDSDGDVDFDDAVSLAFQV